jgi:hypothetical protein
MVFCFEVGSLRVFSPLGNRVEYNVILKMLVILLLTVDCSCSDIYLELTELKNQMCWHLESELRSIILMFVLFLIILN